MNVCSNNKKALALLAIGALEEAEAEALRAHIARCAGCREYLSDMDRVAHHVETARTPEVLEPSPFLRRRVKHAIRERPRPMDLWRRLAIPAFAVGVVFFFTYKWRQAPTPTETKGIPAPIVALNDNEMSVAHYEALAGESWEKLDSTLTEQGLRPMSGGGALLRAGGREISSGAN